MELRISIILSLVLEAAVIFLPCAALSPDGLALLAFKSAVSGDPFEALSTWNEADADPCRWPGISCANVTGSDTPRVVGIAVSSKSLAGYIPSELGSLVYLRRLNLHGNRLSGSIPAGLSNASSLHSVFLYNNQLSGRIPPSLCDLPHLQNLDLSRNSLSGSVPPETRNCHQLQRLLLAENNFSGEIPTGIWKEMRGLIQLDLSSNHFNGSIPEDLGDLGSLGGTLNLSRNEFSGEIPSSLGKLPPVVSIDLRFNRLVGKIPQTGTLANQGPTAFLNNLGLCGLPLQIPCPARARAARGRDSPVPAPVVERATRRKEGLRPGMIILISVADATGVAAIGLVIVYVYWKAKDERKGCSCTGKRKLGGRKRPCSCWTTAGECSETGESEECSDVGGAAVAEAGEGEGELVAIDKGFKLEMDELLRASAYVLGKSGMGIVYRVILANGTPVAVRRLGGSGGAAAGPRYREFAAEAKAVGRLRHRNVVKLRAYYWAHDEKLLVTDFISNGNLSTALQGRQGQPSLSWSMRMRIGRGAARGLAYIHECKGRKYVHGNITANNILVDGEYNSYISDFGLGRLISISGSGGSMTSLSYLCGDLPADPNKLIYLNRGNSYMAPEIRGVPGARPTQKSDVYSFGVVLLELLTGKVPGFSSSSPTPSSSSPLDAVAGLVSWVRKGFEEARPFSGMVDEALLQEVHHAKKDVIAVFHVALACTEVDPDSRPIMKVVSDKLDKVAP